MTLTPNSQEVPVRIVGSSVFGRYPTISAERTYNMFISDEWLVSFAGYIARTTLIDGDAEGRGMFHSVRGGFLLVVVGANVYRFDSISSVIPTAVGSLSTSAGEVFIDENLSSQICIVDGTSTIYIYNHATSTFGSAVLDAHGSDFTANYVTYQNTYFIFGNAKTDASGSNWYIYSSGYIDSGTAFALTYVQTLALQTKPDFAIAALRIPGFGNNLIVFGTSVAEIWTQIASTQIYQRQTSINIDYGCASVATIASSDNMVCWLAINEKSAPCIMVMSGNQAQRISTDGIDYLLSTVIHPGDSTAFFYRQDGHLFYQLTFFNAADNFTLTYDFTTQKFFDLTDWDFSHHPARDVAYFNETTYFISLDDAKIYEMNSEITTYQPTADLVVYDIPRVRVCDTYRLDRPEKFLVDLFTFVVESGTTSGVTDLAQCYGYIMNETTDQIIYTEDGLPLLIESGYCTVGDLGKPRIDVTISKDGGITYSNAVPYVMHNTANFRAQPRFNRLGACNQFTIQMRFWNQGRVLVKNGVIEVRM